MRAQRKGVAKAQRKVLCGGDTPHLHLSRGPNVVPLSMKRAGMEHWPISQMGKVTPGQVYQLA